MIDQRTTREKVGDFLESLVGTWPEHTLLVSAHYFHEDDTENALFHALIIGEAMDSHLTETQRAEAIALINALPMNGDLLEVTPWLRGDGSRIRYAVSQIPGKG